MFKKNFNVNFVISGVIASFWRVFIKFCWHGQKLTRAGWLPLDFGCRRSHSWAELGHWHRKAGSNLIVKRLWRVVGGLLESNLVFFFLFSFYAGSPEAIILASYRACHVIRQLKISSRHLPLPGQSEIRILNLVLLLVWKQSSSRFMQARQNWS